MKNPSQTKSILYLATNPHKTNIDIMIDISMTIKIASMILVILREIFLMV